MFHVLDKLGEEQIHELKVASNVSITLIRIWKIKLKSMALIILLA